MKKRTNLLILGTLTGVSALGAAFVGPFASATCSTDSETGDVTCTERASVLVNISITCTIESGGGSYNATGVSGTASEITANDITISCNDASGFSVYASGYSNDTLGNNKMISSISSSYDIITGTSGSSSYWAMTVDDSTYGVNSYDGYNIIPNGYAEVINYGSSTGTGTYTFTPKYKVYISGTQPAGTYTGAVKYTLVHPSGTAI
ncbi:hypothetical protein IJJ49_00390 [Candidatus Saccharibacteria bacterium]|nr:hypothetical protein [Candidatus Saccharibacteria bacterium]